MVRKYIRVSTSKQSVSRQLKNLRRYYPDGKEYIEYFTGTKLDRPVWNKLRKELKSGDVVVFDEVSRMSRNAEEGFSLYKELYDEGVTLVFLKESHINTESYQAALDIALPEVTTGDEATQELVNGLLEAVKNFMLAKVKQDIYAAFERAQKEVDFLHMRTREGLEVAREAGKRIGTPKGTALTTKKSIKAKEIIRKHCVTFGGTLSDAECLKLAGVSRKTYFKYKKELLNN